MATSEYCSCPPRVPTPTASHVAIASGVNHRVTSPRWTSARSYAGQFPTRYFVLYLGCTLDFTSRSCPFGRHDGQGRDEHLFPRTNATLRALARRWTTLAEEIATHDRHLERLTTETSPTLRASFGVGAHTAAEMLILFGDNPDRIRSEAAFAKLCGACPIPASSGMTTGRHRLNRGGHRQANAALYRAVIVRLRFHQPTVNYVARRTADGRTKRDIIRCLKRFLAREIYQRVMTDYRARQHETQAA